MLSFTFIIAILVLVFAGAYNTYLRLTSPPEVPPGIPWIGVGKGVFAKWRARVKAFGGYIGLIEAGYRKYSAKGLPFILPSLAQSRVLVPRSEVKWIINQPEHVLNVKEMQKYSLQTDYSLLDSTIASNPLHEHTIRRDLTRALGGLIPEIMEELQVGVDKYWGCDSEEWKEVCPFEDMMKIVSRASNRIFVGLPLCRNDEYLENAAAFAQDIAISSFFLRLIPNFLKPFLAWICVIPNRRHFGKCAKHLFPFLSQRLKDIDAGKEVPSDFTTWYIEGLAEQGGLLEKNPEKIALRLMTVNFAAIHTSTFTATNILFDLFSMPPEKGFVDGIRDEVKTLLEENGGKWDKNMLAKMIKTDSAVRESLRISTFMAHGMDRLVVDPKGVTMDDSLHLPQGTRLGTSVWAIHHDDGVYPKARSYDAFRFSRAREEALTLSKEISSEDAPPAKREVLGNGGSQANRIPQINRTAKPQTLESENEKRDLDKLLESKNLSTVTTSDTFLSFGHGRHACPGRFFAATEMKLLLAYIVMNYDIKSMETRPPNEFMGGNVLPPMKANIRVRRRKGC